MAFKNLTPEQIEKANSCRTPEDILALAKEEGYDLTDEELSQVAGGGSFAWNLPEKCPSCGSKNIYHYTNDFYCRDCGHEWLESGL